MAVVLVTVVVAIDDEKDDDDNKEKTNVVTILPTVSHDFSPLAWPIVPIPNPAHVRSCA